MNRAGALFGGLALCLALALPASALASHAEPLRGQWHVDTKTTGGTDVTADSSGHNLNASTGANTMQLGPGGRFTNFLTEANTSVVTANSSLLRPPQVTLLAWVRNSGDPGTLKYIAGQGDEGANCSGGSSYALYTGYPGFEGLKFYIRSVAGPTYYSPSASASLWDGGWHLVAGTFDGATMRLFVDGLQVGSGAPAGASINYGFSGTNFYFGGYPTVCPGGDWPGGIDEVRVYSRALNGSELRRMAIYPGADPPALEPDGDDDFIPDSRDNCPTVPNPGQEDPDGNGIGNSCEGAPEARFVYSPNPVCIGEEVQFNATHALAGKNGPITNYSWTYQEAKPEVSVSLRGEIRVRYYHVTTVIHEGTDSTPTYRWNWNTQEMPYLSGPGTITIPPAGRSPVPVTLTITDSAGGTASTTEYLQFQRTRSDQSRGHCPLTVAEGFIAPTPGKVFVTQKSLVIASRCVGKLTCSGALLAILPTGNQANAAARKKKRVTILARAPYLLEAGEKRRIRAPFTKAGKKLLRKRRRVKVSLISRNPNGKARTKSKIIKIKLPAKKKKKG